MFFFYLILRFWPNCFAIWRNICLAIYLSVLNEILRKRKQFKTFFWNREDGRVEVGNKSAIAYTFKNTISIHIFFMNMIHLKTRSSYSINQYQSINMYSVIIRLLQGEIACSRANPSYLPKNYKWINYNWHKELKDERP